MFTKSNKLIVFGLFRIFFNFCRSFYFVWSILQHLIEYLLKSKTECLSICLAKIPECSFVVAVIRKNKHFYDASHSSPDTKFNVQLSSIQFMLFCFALLFVCSVRQCSFSMRMKRLRIFAT